jgi:hypothetical protein
MQYLQSPGVFPHSRILGNPPHLSTRPYEVSGRRFRNNSLLCPLLSTHFIPDYEWKIRADFERHQSGQGEYCTFGAFRALALPGLIAAQIVVNFNLVFRISSAESTQPGAALASGTLAVLKIPIQA